MIDLLIIVSVAISAFIATNIDDLFLLVIFFGHPQYNSSSVIIGQYLGIILLIMISIPAYFFKTFIPDFLLILMGFIPIFIGIKEIITLKTLENSKTKENPKSQDNIQDLDDKIKSDLPRTKLKSKSLIVASFAVAFVTISNGADNIGVYAPLFSNLNQYGMILTILVFLIMTGIWCILSQLIVKNNILGTKIEKYGHIILPFVLIILGISIVVSNILK